MVSGKRKRGLPLNPEVNGILKPRKALLFLRGFPGATLSLHSLATPLDASAKIFTCSAKDPGASAPGSIRGTLVAAKKSRASSTQDVDLSASSPPVDHFSCWRYHRIGLKSLTPSRSTEHRAPACRASFLLRPTSCGV